MNETVLEHIKAALENLSKALPLVKNENWIFLSDHYNELKEFAEHLEGF